MRRIKFARAAGVLVALCLAAASSVVVTGAQAEPGPGYFASGNVEYVSSMPIHSDGVGARIVGKYMYLTTERDLTIYDISKPAAPERVGFLLFTPPQEFYFPEEDVDTNGHILLSGSQGTLNVIDVSDKAAPEVIGSVDGADEHTISCVLDCRYAYGSEGVIVDLRKPRRPRIVGNWAKHSNTPRGGHDVTEVAPGLVMTSTQPIQLLDARKNPVRPKVLATGSNRDKRFIHGNRWPRRMKDKFLLAGGETTGPSCGSADSGAFMTWSTRKWKARRSFRMIDQYRVKNGNPNEGDAPANLFCTHWFDTHPTWRNGGLVAMGWYEHGTRFLKVSHKGKISEAGYFLPFGGSTSAAYWVSKKIVYSVDYNRGLDIIRFTGKT
jgi:hypothetical protein